MSSNSAMKSSEDLAFLGGDPGAVKYGNFINYYSFHSVIERIDNLQSTMFPTLTLDKPILCLDIGCNTGELSIELYSYLKTLYPSNIIQMLALDIDPVLIHRAQETNTNSNIKFLTVNVMSNAGREAIKTYLDSHGKESFDVTFCFSVTMWIHLNTGDEGLKDFLRYLKEKSMTIVIEPQPWSCYRNAQKRVKKSGSTFPLYETIQIRSNVDKVIEHIMSDNLHKKVYESTASSWKRKIQSYHQQIKNTSY